MRNRRTRNGKS